MLLSRALASRLPFLFALATLACTDQQNLGNDEDDTRGDAATQHEEDPVMGDDAGTEPTPDRDGASEPERDGGHLEPAEDAGSDETDGSTPVPVPACSPEAPFIISTWNRLPQNGEIDDAEDAWLSPNQLKLFFSRSSIASGGRGTALYEQTRLDSESAFSGTKMLFTPEEGDLNDARTSTFGVRPTLSADLLSLYYVNDYGWIMHATRSDARDQFPKPVAVVYDKDSRAESGPSFARHDSELWFAAQHGDVGLPFPGFPGGGGEDSNYDLMRVSLGAGDAEAVPVSELNSEQDELAPVLSSDGLWIYFRSNRPNSLEPGVSALFVARRDSVDEPFGTPEEMLDMGSVTPLYLSPDFCSLYYEDGGTVYEAERQQ